MVSGNGMRELRCFLVTDDLFRAFENFQQGGTTYLMSVGYLPWVALVIIIKLLIVAVSCFSVVNRL